MFTEMRRIDRQLADEQAIELLKSGCYGFLAINNLQGCGYAVPMNYAQVGQSIYLHCALEGKKLELIRQDNRVSFCVVGDAVVLSAKFTMRYHSVMAFGRIYEVTDSEEKQLGLMALVTKYSTSPEEVAMGQKYAQNSESKTAVLRIEIEHITGKSNA
ncbi:MAG: pyridoxamine 5'-phosphate oxidase family protein [Armatimonadota bacterium]